ESRLVIHRKKFDQSIRDDEIHRAVPDDAGHSYRAHGVNNQAIPAFAARRPTGTTNSASSTDNVHLIRRRWRAPDRLQRKGQRELSISELPPEILAGMSTLSAPDPLFKTTLMMRIGSWTNGAVSQMQKRCCSKLAGPSEALLMPQRPTADPGCSAAHAQRRMLEEQHLQMMQLEELMSFLPFPRVAPNQAQSGVDRC
uniref:RPAP1_C domain-containing protein n=1 Tax=Macrostomum lignano TaxID=282301 RepID=A0A1I8FA38_9PLAT